MDCDAQRMFCDESVLKLQRCARQWTRRWWS
jgi:hypothetical protein